MTSLVIIILSSGIVCFSGCQEGQQTTDPNLLVTEELGTSDLPARIEDRQAQAVSLYVDATMLKELNEREKALRKLNYAIELDPKFAFAYSLKGDILLDMKKYEDSADAYEQATIHDPYSFKDFFNLGNVCRIIKQWERAAKAYIAACQLDPQHYPAHLRAAQCYYELGDYDSSLTYANKAKELNPEQADPELLMGDLFEAQKDHVQAINAYRRALELEGNNPAVMISLARAYLRFGRYSSAKELLNGALSIDPESGMAHQYLGYVQLKLKETDEAVESYRQAITLDENDWMARKGLGVAYILMSTKSENAEQLQALAVEQWHISLQIKPDQPRLREWVRKYQ